MRSGSRRLVVDERAKTVARNIRAHLEKMWRGQMYTSPIDSRILAGIQVPATPIIDQAMEYARQKCEPYLLNHVVRSWLFAVRLGQIQNIEHDAEVVAVGTLLHDITLNKDFAGPRRFEVEAADLARSFATDLGFDKRRAQLIWDSVALNSTASIALHKEAEVALGTMGIGLDYGGFGFEAVIPPAEMRDILQAFPRLKMKHSFAETCRHLVTTRPETSHDNFLRDFGERFVPGYKPISTVDLLMKAPFDE